MILPSTMIKKDDVVIMKVWKRKSTDQKMITIPKFCDIEEGDFVRIIKIKK